MNRQGDRHAGFGGERRPRLEDVARLAGVSPTTVSRALRDDARISEPTRRAVQVAAGLTRYLGTPDSPPVRQGFDLVAVDTGIAAVQAILAAVLWREQTGEGQKVEVSMLETATNAAAPTAKTAPRTRRGVRGAASPSSLARSRPIGARKL